MSIIVNGEVLDLKENHQLISLLRQLLLAEKKGIAVAVNDEVIPRKDWSEYVFKENDSVIIIEAAQGG